MNEGSSLTDLRKSIESLPVFVILNSLYGHGDWSPVAEGKPAREKYAELVKLVDAHLNTKLQTASPSTARDLPFTALFSLAEMILYSSGKTPDILLEVMNPNYRGDYLSCHSLNVAFLSCRVGLVMNLEYRHLTELGVAALLHDIGMTKLDTDCYLRKADLSEVERAAVHRHPQLGWHFLEGLRSEFPWLLRVIIEEHTRENGTGYPDGVQGEHHLYSKIIGLCDTFEALSHNRIFRKAFHPGDAMKSIIQSKEMFFAKDVLRPAIDALSMYPVGSLVKLNNNKIALVVESVDRAPLRPIVQILDDTSLDESQRRINLSNEGNMYILGMVYTEQYQIPEEKAANGG